MPIRAEQKADLSPPTARAVLVTEQEISIPLQNLADVLGIEVMDNETAGIGARTIGTGLLLPAAGVKQVDRETILASIYIGVKGIDGNFSIDACVCRGGDDVL